MKYVQFKVKSDEKIGGANAELPALHGGIHRAAHTQSQTHTSPGHMAAKSEWDGRDREWIFFEKGHVYKSLQ